MSDLNDLYHHAHLHKNILKRNFSILTNAQRKGVWQGASSIEEPVELAAGYNHEELAGSFSKLGSNALAHLVPSQEREQAKHQSNYGEKMK